MKRCPRCEKTYPDSETFCEADGTALVQAGPAFAEGAGAGDEGAQVECPVCGGKAQPGELICNFCGARLGVESAARHYTPPPPRPATSRESHHGAARSVAVDANHGQDAEGRRRRKRPRDVRRRRISDRRDRRAGRRRLARASSKYKGAEAPVANASPSAAASVAAPAPTGPLVALANAMGVQVTGESASAPERNQETAQQIFRRSQGHLARQLYSCAGR